MLPIGSPDGRSVMPSHHFLSMVCLQATTLALVYIQGRNVGWNSAKVIVRSAQNPSKMIGCKVAFEAAGYQEGLVQVSESGGILHQALSWVDGELATCLPWHYEMWRRRIWRR